MSDQKSKTISQKLHELEELLAWFEQEDIDIEQAVDKFETGSRLASEIREQLDGVENKISVLQQRFDQDA